TTRALGKCQSLAKSSHKSSKVADYLEEKNKHVNKMNVTRWNSEYLMIKSILSVGKEDLESIAKLMESPVRLSNNDLIVLQEIVDILEPFNELTVKCQSEKLVTASAVVPAVVHLIVHLRDIKANISFCNKLIQQLESSLEKRFAGIISRLNQSTIQYNDPFNDPVYFMTAVLDPSFKFLWLSDLKLPVNDENRLKQSIIQLILDEISKDVTNPSGAHSSSTTASPPSSTPKPKRRKLFVYNDSYDDDDSNLSSLLNPGAESENYLNDPMRIRFSEYWVNSRLNVLKKLVERIFTLQASSAPVERVFSHAGLILSPRRSNMNEELFRDLIFLKVNQGLL
ncbi:unnamed protein product, partial [Adineta ricciae]